MLLPSRAGVRILTFFKWDLEVESLKRKSQSVIEAAVEFSGKKLWTHNKKVDRLLFGNGFWFRHLSYNHALSPMRELEFHFKRDPPPSLFGDCPLSTVVQLKIVVITHRFQRIESISMQMTPSYLMRLTDHDNKYGLLFAAKSGDCAK